jgi:predicted ATP-dependent protease
MCYAEVVMRVGANAIIFVMGTKKVKMPENVVPHSNIPQGEVRVRKRYVMIAHGYVLHVVLLVVQILNVHIFVQYVELPFVANVSNSVIHVEHILVVNFV